MSNAYTMAADTMYYFDVGWEHLDGILNLGLFLTIGGGGGMCVWWWWRWGCV